MKAVGEGADVAEEVGVMVRRGSGLLASLAVFGAALLSPAPAYSDSADRISMQAGMSPGGVGTLFVNDPGGPWAWEACSPSLRSCVPFGMGREIKTAGAPPGTVFRVNGGGATGVSPEWRGRLRQQSPPTVEGTVRANDFVSLVPGGWSGGWKGEYSAMQLSACLTPAGRECITLTHPHYVRSCAASDSFVLDARFAGRYLRVADKRIGAGPPVLASYAVSSPHGGESWDRSPTTSVAVVAPIDPAVRAYPGECGPSLPADAVISRRGVASITCQAGCRAVLVARGDGRQARVVRRLPEQNALFAAPPAELRVPNPTLARVLRTGDVRLTVKLDGKQVAQRTVLSDSRRNH